jgi:hypothetical protein
MLLAWEDWSWWSLWESPAPDFAPPRSGQRRLCGIHPMASTILSATRRRTGSSLFRHEICSAREMRSSMKP